MGAAGIKSQYRRTIARQGEAVVFRRFTGSGPNRPELNVEIRGRVTGYEPKDMIAGIQQGDRKVLVLAEDLILKNIRSVTNSDFLVVRGRQCAIFSIDDSTHRIGADLVAYELGVRG